jgi:hypothetical protein
MGPFDIMARPGEFELAFAFYRASSRSYSSSIRILYEYALTDAAPFLEDAVEDVNQAILVVLEPQVDHVFIEALLLELRPLPISYQTFIYLLFHALLLGNAQIIQGLFEARRLEVQVHFIELFVVADFLDLIAFRVGKGLSCREVEGGLGGCLGFLGKGRSIGRGCGAP